MVGRQSKEGGEQDGAEAETQLGTTLDACFCIEALRRALARGRPEICNTDQGAQFTSQEFLACVEGAEVRVSMDGRGRAHWTTFSWSGCGGA